MMELVMHTEKNDTMFHTKKTRMLRLVVEIDVGGMTTDVVDKSQICSTHEEECSRTLCLLKIVPTSCCIYSYHLGVVKISSKSHVVILPSYNLVYFFGLVTPFSSTVGQRSGQFSTDSSIIHPCSPDRIALSAKLVILKFVINLVIRQRVEDFQLGIESYQTQLNLTKPRWDATGLEYKHDYTVIDSLKAVTFRDRYGVQMIMRFNEIHKFSNGTLHQIDEALEYRLRNSRLIG
uniref:Uncharacterized protein n=1 Tax=Tanacetum cinerariifolium TaxID=118510 RepID=A0A6L2K662_TANCI|nr:hypothetical protein [Tanacetum cinerariifolium]